MFKLSPLELPLTDANLPYTFTNFQLQIKDLLDDFESYGLLDCSTMFKILNERLITL
jgi:hypothetical protein